MLAVAGMLLGVHGTPNVAPTEHSQHLLRLMPGSLELGGVDHTIHFILAAVFIFGGLSKDPSVRTKLTEPTKEPAAFK